VSDNLLKRLMGQAVDKPAAAAPREAQATADLTRALHSVRRQLLELTGLVQQQSDFTVEALHRAGWQSDAEATQQAALRKALRLVDTAEPDVIVGPWTGEVGFELMYWIPFLNWLVEQGFDSRRMVVVSRGGASAWYRHLTSRYVDVLDVVSPADFKSQTAGPKKQLEGRGLDRQIVDAVRARLQVAADAPVLHPAAMYRLFQALWRRQASVELVQSFTVYKPIDIDDAPLDLDVPLPAGYIAAKFYFSKAFPDSAKNRRAVTELLQAVSRQAPVALLTASTRLDDHVDIDAPAGSGIYVVDSHRVPQNNLTFQSRVIAASRGFVGTYGGFSYLAPFLGVRSLSVFSRRDGFENHHLECANQVFDKLLPGGFLAIDRRALDMVAPTVTGWQRMARAATTEASEAGTR
jgi:hypothetical protein